MASDDTKVDDQGTSKPTPSPASPQSPQTAAPAQPFVPIPEPRLIPFSDPQREGVVRMVPKPDRIVTLPADPPKRGE